MISWCGQQFRAKVQPALRRTISGQCRAPGFCSFSVPSPVIRGYGWPGGETMAGAAPPPLGAKVAARPARTARQDAKQHTQSPSAPRRKAAHAARPAAHAEPLRASGKQHMRSSKRARMLMHPDPFRVMRLFSARDVIPAGRRQTRSAPEDRPPPPRTHAVPWPPLRRPPAGGWPPSSRRWCGPQTSRCIPR
jgi:hypothetical protein